MQIKYDHHKFRLVSVLLSRLNLLQINTSVRPVLAVSVDLVPLQNKRMQTRRLTANEKTQLRQFIGAPWQEKTTQTWPLLPTLQTKTQELQSRV